MKVGFNKRYVQGITKEKFIREFKDVYPYLDLGKEYDKIVPPKAKTPKEDKEEPKE